MYLQIQHVVQLQHTLCHMCTFVIDLIYIKLTIFAEKSQLGDSLQPWARLKFASALIFFHVLIEILTTAMVHYNAVLETFFDLML